MGLQVHKEDAHGRRPEANPLFVRVGTHDQGDVARAMFMSHLVGKHIPVKHNEMRAYCDATSSAHG